MENHFLVLVLGGLLGLHRTDQLLSISGWGIGLNYCDIEWFALEMNLMQRTNSLEETLMLGKIEGGRRRG